MLFFNKKYMFFIKSLSSFISIINTTGIPNHLMCSHLSCIKDVLGGSQGDGSVSKMLALL